MRRAKVSKFVRRLLRRLDRHAHPRRHDSHGRGANSPDAMLERALKQARRASATRIVGSYFRDPLIPGAGSTSASLPTKTTFIKNAKSRNRRTFASCHGLGVFDLDVVEQVPLDRAPSHATMRSLLHRMIELLHFERVVYR